MAVNVGFLGLGKLGLPCALAIESRGHKIYGYDISESVQYIIKSRKIPYREIGAQELLDKSEIELVDVPTMVKQCEIIFVPIQTPRDEAYEGITRIPSTRKDFDYTFLKAGMKTLADEIGKQKTDTIVIIISTVLPGTIRREIIPMLNRYVKLCYNPFFIAMGTTIRDFLNPEFILLGVDGKQAAEVAEEFYRDILPQAKLFKTTIESAELIKVAYNTFIGMKIAFINTMMEICYHTNADVDAVRDALTMATNRLISGKYLSAGMGDGGGCLLPDEIIYTENGPVEIQDIEVGDRVLAGDGKLYSVTETYKRPYKGTVLKLKVRGLPASYITPEHPIHVAKDLRQKYRTGTEVRYSNGGDITQQVGDPTEVLIGDLHSDYYTLFPAMKEATIPIPDHAIDDYIELAGYYLSEGSIWNRRDRGGKASRVEFHFHEDEVEYHEEVCTLIRKILPEAQTRKITKADSKAVSVRINSTTLASKLYQDFGKGAETKVIPAWIVYGEEKLGVLLLKGLWRGDGSSSSHGFNYSTISKNLAYSISLLLRKFDIAHTLQIQKPRLGEDGVPHKLAYEVRVRNAVYIKKLSEVTGMPIKHKMQDKRYPNVIFKKGDFWYHHIQEIKEEFYEGTVYNLNIEPIHNYVCSIGTVENCHPRDNIALSWLARKLNLSYDLFEAVMMAREKQTEWLARLMMEWELPKYILGKSFKPETNITTGSPAILLKNILEELGEEVIQYDPYVDDKAPEFKCGIYLIGTKHPDFEDFDYPKGSVVLDPWGYVRPQPSITVFHIGRDHEI